MARVGGSARVCNWAEARGEVGGELAGVNGTRSSPVPRPVVTLGSSSPSPAAPRCGSCLPAALSSVAVPASPCAPPEEEGSVVARGEPASSGSLQDPPRRGPTGLEEWVWAWFLLLLLTRLVHTHRVHQFSLRHTHNNDRSLITQSVTPIFTQSHSVSHTRTSSPRTKCMNHQ